MKLLLTDLVVEDRLRRDLGDVNELAESISVDGLLQSPVAERREDGKYYLVAGGRRYAALTLLASNGDERFKEIEVTILNDLAPSQRRKIELVENIQRLDMAWQEKALGIAEYHKLARREARKDGDSWTQEQTGRLLNMSQANVSIALDVADELKDRDSVYWKCESLQAALQLKAKLRLDEANKELLGRLQARRDAAQQAANKACENIPLTTSPLAVQEKLEAAVVKAVESTPKITKAEIHSFYYEGDCLDVLPTLAKTHVINHIICDPPYGIDMSMLAGADAGREVLIERTAGEHTVEGNLHLLPKFLKTAYDVIAEDGFLCMWYDLDHHEKIAGWASEIGWRVCRWPIVWCKTSACMNNAAQYNVTKATEVCYVMRRSEKSMIKVKQAKNFIMAPTAASATHPFCKPYEVWKYLLETFTTEGQTVVDPFAGEGSALAAMFKMHRLPVGIEIDSKHIGNGLSYIEAELNDPFNALLSTNVLV